MSSFIPKQIAVLTVIVVPLTAVARPTFPTRYDWGEHKELESASAQRWSLFIDGYQFHSGPIESLTATALGAPKVMAPPPFDDVTIFSIDGTVELYRGMYDDHLDYIGGRPGEHGYPGLSQLIGSFSFDSDAGSVTHQFGPLPAGDYFYRISGDTNFSQGGAYQFTSALVPAVPEPDTYAMLGIGFTGLIMRLRKRNTNIDRQDTASRPVMPASPALSAPA